MPVLSLACHLPHNTPNIPSRYNNEQTTKQTKAINNSHIYIYISCKCDTNRAGHFTLDAYASRPVACLKCVHNVFQLRTNTDAHWRVLSERIRTFLQHYLLFISNYSTQNLFKMYRNACSVIHVSSDTLVGHIPRRFMQLNRSQNIDWLKLQIRFQCEKLSELFTGATFKLFFSFMVISDVWGSFIPNKNIFTSIALLSGF